MISDGTTGKNNLQTNGICDDERIFVMTNAGRGKQISVAIFVRYDEHWVIDLFNKILCLSFFKADFAIVEKQRHKTC